MDPRSLSTADFESYAPLARKLARDQIELLRDLPLVLCAIVVREVADFDSRFPRERNSIEFRLAFLASLSKEERYKLTRGFAALQLSPELLAADWIHSPQRFEEDFSAYLWASKQLDAFRATATKFTQEVDRSIPPWHSEAQRWVVVVLGPELRKDGYPLFRKLRSQGVYFPNVAGDDGFAAILSELASRASGTSVPYGHWYIDGGESEEILPNSICRCSWTGSTALRTEVLERVETIVDSGGGDPERLRSAMAKWRPKKHAEPSGDELVDRFVLSVYADGSGSQVFSTTFVQWATREILRRAEPISVVVRYGARQKQRTLNEMFSKQSETVPDAAGSLVDADFGAYTTWINLSRLAGSEQARFIAWSQGCGQAIVIGPDCPRGTEAADRTDVAHLLRF